MAAAVILKIDFLAITHRPIVRFQRNFVWESKTAWRRGLHEKNCKFFKSKMADGRHFENCLIAISQSKIVRFWWNLVHYIRYWTRLQLKFLKFKMAAAAILKIPFLAITHRLISVQFCMRKQNGMSTRAKWQNLQIFKIQDGRRPPFWKSLNCHISVKNRPILIKFDTLHQILNPITVTWPKIEIFEI